MTDAVVVRGAGGKDGGGAHTPTETADSLRSKAYANVLDLVCEGPIKGPAKPGLEWVFLDGVPLENPDGSLNFKDVTVGWNLGTQSQEYLPGFTAVESETVVGVEVKYGVPITRTITDSSIDQVRVTLGFPALMHTDTSTGDISGTSVDISIEIQNAGAGFQTVVNDTISGKTTTGYERSYVINLPGSGPWDIRVNRITADSGSATLQNATTWARYTSITDEKFTYPNSAIVGLSIDSEQFQNIPTRGYELDLILCKVPTNYDPIARTYTGVWDGSWKIAWTNNPVWCTYDFIINKRYGCGRRLNETNLDKFALYTQAQYCDGFVSSGIPARGSFTTGSISLGARAVQPSYTGSLTFNKSAKTITRASGDWVADGMVPGDTIYVSGTARNNVFFTIKSVSALVITVREAPSAEIVSCTVLNSRVKYQYYRASGSFITDGFKAKDEVAVTGFVIGTNNGRAVVQHVSNLYLTLDEKTLTNDASAAGRVIQTVAFTEPRFTCNVYWQVADNAYRTISAMASIFRAMVYWGNNTLNVVQDAPRDRSLIFNKANVRDGKFAYSGGAARTTHTTAMVDWINPANGYKPAVEVVEDPLGIALYGVNPLKIPAVGCTSQGQAQRLGRWALFTERIEPELVTFQSAFEGMSGRPGEICGVVDDDRMQVVRSGRVFAYTDSTHLTLDAPVVFSTLGVYTLSIVMPTGALENITIVNPGNVSTATIQLASPLSQPVSKGAIFIITSTLEVTRDYRILSVTDKSTDTEIWYEVVAMLFVPEKFDLVEDDMILQTYGPTLLTTKNPVTNVGIGEYHVATAKGTRHVVTVGWGQQSGARSYIVKWRRNSGEWNLISGVQSPYTEFEVPELGTIDVAVSAVYLNGQSIPTNASYAMVGKDTNPVTPSGLSITYTSSGFNFKWDKNPEGDVVAYEIRQGVTGGTWATASVVSSFYTSNIYTWASSFPTGCILYIAAIDASGNQSTPASINVPALPTPSGVTIAFSTTRPT